MNQTYADKLSCIRKTICWKWHNNHNLFPLHENDNRLSHISIVLPFKIIDVTVTSFKSRFPLPDVGFCQPDFVTSNSSVKVVIGRSDLTKELSYLAPMTSHAIWWVLKKMFWLILHQIYSTPKPMTLALVISSEFKSTSNNHHKTSFVTNKKEHYLWEYHRIDIYIQSVNKTKSILLILAHHRCQEQWNGNTSSFTPFWDGSGEIFLNCTDHFLLNSMLQILFHNHNNLLFY